MQTSQLPTAALVIPPISNAVPFRVSWGLTGNYQAERQFSLSSFVPNQIITIAENEDVFTQAKLGGTKVKVFYASLIYEYYRNYYSF